MSSKKWKTLKNNIKCPRRGTKQYRKTVEESLGAILDSLEDKLISVKGIPDRCPITLQIPRNPTNIITTENNNRANFDIQSNFLEDQVYEADALSHLKKRISPVTRRRIIAPIPDNKTRKKMIHALTKNQDVYRFLCHKIISHTPHVT